MFSRNISVESSLREEMDQLSDADSGVRRLFRGRNRFRLTLRLVKWFPSPFFAELHSDSDGKTERFFRIGFPRLSEVTMPPDANKSLASVRIPCVLFFDSKILGSFQAGPPEKPSRKHHPVRGVRHRVFSGAGTVGLQSVEIRTSCRRSRNPGHERCPL